MTITQKTDKTIPLTSTPRSAEARAMRRVPGLFAPTTDPTLTRPSSLIPHLTNAEIQQKSLLQNPNFLTQIKSSNWASMLDAKLFAHVTSDVFVQNSDLEGLNLKTTSLYASRFLSFLQNEKNLFNPAELTEFQKRLSQLQQSPTAAEMTSQVANLKPGESLLLNGGWKGTEKTTGHAMIYEFIRRSNGNFDLVVYNTGGGAEYHPTLMAKNQKVKIQRMLKFENVLPEEFGLSNDSIGTQHPDFFQDLIHCREHTHEKDMETTPEQIYQKTLGHLSQKQASAGSNASFFSTPQRAGTCSEYVLKPLTLKSLCKDDMSLFKKQHLYKRFYATIAFMQQQEDQLSQDTQESSNVRLLLKKSATKLLRTAAKLYDPHNPEKSLLSFEEAAEVKATLTEIQHKVQLADRQIQRNRLQGTKSSEFSAKGNSSLASHLLNQDRVTIPTQKSDLNSQAPSTLTLPTGSTFPNHLVELLAKVDEMAKTDPLAAIWEMGQLFQALPVPSSAGDLCASIPEDLIAPSIGALFGIIQKYTHLCGKHTNFTPAQENNILSMFAYLHRLTTIQDGQIFCDQAKLQEFVLDFSVDDNVLKDAYLVFYDPKVFERRKELLQYFKKPCDHTQENLRFGHFPTQLDPSQKSPADIEGDYLLSMIEKDSELQKVYDQALSKQYSDSWRELQKLPSQTVRRGAALLHIFDEPFLSSKKVGHIFKLRQAAFLCKQFAVDCQNMSAAQEAGIRMHLYESFKELTCNMKTLAKTSPGQSDAFTWDRKSASMHYDQNQKAMNGILDKNVLNRKQDKKSHLTESVAYTNEIDGPKVVTTPVPFATVLDATNCKPSLQPAKVLYHYTHHLSELETPEAQASVQTLFDVLFFKPYVPDTKSAVAEIPLFQELPENSALQKQSIDFIEKGLNYFYKKQPGGRPKVEVCLFFTRLATRLRTIYPNLETINPGAQMDEWLQNPSLTVGERSLIHLHKILHYNSMAFERLSNEQVADMMGSWFFINQNPIAQPFHHPHLDEEARQSIYARSSLLEDLLKNPEARALICNRILLICNLPYESATWNGTYPFYEQGTLNSFCQINLLKAQIANEEGLLSMRSDPQIYGDPGYIHLFGKHRYIMKRFDAQLSFEHPTYGLMRAFQKDGMNDFYFFRKIDGNWLQYIPPATLSPKAVQGENPTDHWDSERFLPTPLIANHTHWLSVDGNSLSIYSKNDPSNRIAIVSGNTIALHYGEVLKPIDAIASAWKEFARPNMYIALSKQKEGPLAKIQIPNYESLAERKLQFTVVNNQWQWEENPEFFVASNQAFSSHLPNALLLENGTGKQKKLLLPMREIQGTKSISPHIALKIQEAPNTVVLEYDLQNDAIIPTQIEGTIYYAYLLLTKKKHGEALKLLDSIPRGLTLSPVSSDALLWIVLHPPTSPASAAIQLRALEQLDLRPTPEKHKAGLLPLKIAAARKALKYMVENGKNNISFDVRLSDSSTNNSVIFEQTPLSLPSTRLDEPNLRSLAYYSSDTPRWILDDLKKPVDSSYAPTIVNEFSRLYELARTAHTNEQKIQLATIFRYVRESKIDIYGNKFCGPMIHLAFLYPEIAPPLPQVMTAEWIHEAKNLYEQVQTQKFLPKREQVAPAHKSPIKEGALEIAFTNTLPIERPKAPIKAVNLALASPAEEQMHPLNLSQFVKGHFKTNPKPETIPHAPLTPLPDFADENFTLATLAEIQEFQNDYEDGAAKAQQKVSFALNGQQKPRLQSLQASLESEIRKEKQSLEAIQAQIYALVHKKAPNPQLQLQEELLRKGEALIPPRMEELITVFHRGDINGFASVNRYLTEQDIIHLNQSIFEYLLRETEIAQANRAKSLVQSLLDPKTLNREVLENQLAQTLNARIAYEPHQEKTMLVFEHRAGIRLRPNQVALVRKMLETEPGTKQYRNVVAQLMMGGGKTTVIASLLLEFAAKPGRIPLFIAPSAQFETLRTNVSMAQLKNFQRQVIPVDLTRQAMNEKALGLLNKQLHQAYTDGSVVLIRAETLQALQLEFLSLIKELIGTVKAGNRPNGELVQKISLLQNSLGLFAKKADALMDEVDVVLAPQKVVNFPTGEFDPIAPNWVDLMQVILELHVSDDVTVQMLEKTMSVNAALQLREKRETAFDAQLYKNIISPVIVKQLFARKHKDWKMDARFAENFERYVLGQMKRNALSAQDVEFLQLFQALGKSQDMKTKDIADEIALAKEYFQSILPTVLPKEGNRNFGRTRSTPPGKVVPFVGVDSPATSEFGNPFEAGFYQFLTALRFGVQEEQIKTVAIQMDQAVQHLVQKTELAYDQTPEAIEFLALTGVPLHRIHDPGNIQKAEKYVNANLDRMFKIEAETTCAIVGGFRHFFSSNAQNLEAQLSTKRTLSGTPFNHCSYSESLKENLALDVGVEGEIIHALITRNCPIRSYTQANISVILKEAIDSGTPSNRLRGFIDASGILTNKDSDNLNVAKDILAFFANDPSIDTILFFGRKSPDEAAPNHLFALRKGAQGKPEYIGTTDAKVLKARGINPEKTFIYYDENHCEATDLPQKPDAINLLSLSEKTTRRDFCQGALRLRQFFDGQTIEGVIAAEARKKLPNGGQKFQDVVPLFSQNQAVLKAKENYRSYQQKIDHDPRQVGINALLEARTMNELVSAFTKHENTFLMDQTIRPFEQFGGLDELLDTQTALQNKVPSDPSAKKATIRMNRIFESLHPKASASPVLHEAAIDPYLPKQVIHRPSSTLGQTVEVQQQVHVEQNVQQETEIEQELDRELQRYNSMKGKYTFDEASWKDIGTVHVPPVTPVGAPIDGPQIHSLKEVLSKPVSYLKPYAEIFDSNILISKNLALSYNEFVPVFSKAQKPAHQILVLADKTPVQFVLLSIHDADHFKRMLAKYKPKDAWLMLPDGKELSHHVHDSLDSAGGKALSRALLQVNLFNGNAAYLAMREKETQAFMKESNLELKRRFLTLKVEKNKQQRTIFYRNEVLSGKHQMVDKDIKTMARRRYEIAQAAATPLDGARVARL